MGAWRLTGLVVCGGVGQADIMSAVWRLDLGELRWLRKSSLILALRSHACCAVRGGVVVLGGQHALSQPVGKDLTDCINNSRDETKNELKNKENIFSRAPPPLYCGPRR